MRRSKTDTEIDALRNAISNEFMNHQGWTTDNNGRVKENGIQVFKAGYITAIHKILNKYKKYIHYLKKV
ncbi:gamma-mobile-trio protein GmtX [Psychrobacillus psychrodurans]|nr:gamma-mobile-trio protein GmtX [Psychrobacillus psychrodurans]